MLLEDPLVLGVVVVWPVVVGAAVVLLEAELPVTVNDAVVPALLSQVTKTRALPVDEDVGIVNVPRKLCVPAL